MKKSLVLLVAALLMGFTASAATVSFDFANVSAALIRFDGATDSFTFPNGVNGIDFLVSGQNSEWPGSVLNYRGDLIAPPGGWLMDATGNPAGVSGTGTLVLSNVGGTATLTGDLVWDSIGTFLNIGGLNLFTSANLTNMSMVGTDANLASLLSAGEAEIIVSFQQITTSPQQTEGCDELIGQIRCGGISTGSYSGTLTADVANVPEPGTYVMLGAGLVGLAMLRRRAVK